MLNIGICDDSADARLNLRSMLERILETRCAGNLIYEFSSGEGLLGWLGKHQGEIDLVFLDIEMGGLSGMDTARSLRERDAGLQIVFVTGYADYVYDGYSVGALGYILKPPKPRQLEDILTRALSALYRNADDAFVCRSGESVFRIQRGDILYFASDRRLLRCVTSAREYTFYGRLDDVEKQLDERFVRIHQRYLIAACAVVSIDSGEVTLKDGAVLPLSRSRQSEAMLALTRAMLK